jgi:hypothetical protein
MPSNVFSVRSDQQDVEMLLSNGAEALRQWEEGPPPVLDLSMMLDEAGKVSHRARCLKGQWNVDSSAIIQSTRPVLGSWIIRFQDWVRKLTWWYLEPIIQQIRMFQMNAALTVDGLAQNEEQQLARQEDLAAELAALRKRLEDLEALVGATGGNANADAEAGG